MSGDRIRVLYLHGLEESATSPKPAALAAHASLDVFTPALLIWHASVNGLPASAAVADLRVHGPVSGTRVRAPRAYPANTAIRCRSSSSASESPSTVRAIRARRVLPNSWRSRLTAIFTASSDFPSFSATSA